jgi:hypothetical protein
MSADDDTPKASALISLISIHSTIPKGVLNHFTPGVDHSSVFWTNPSVGDEQTPKFPISRSCIKTPGDMQLKRNTTSG